MIDSGATVSAMGEDVFLRLFSHSRFRNLGCNMGNQITGVNNTPLTIIGCYEIPIIIKRREYFTPMFIIKGLATDVILGK